MGWVNYRSGFGTIVDRFRWEDGCIAEHVSLFILSFRKALTAQQ